MLPQTSRLYLKLILTMLFWGGTWIAGRIAVQEMAPLIAAVYRFAFATLSLGYLVYRHYQRIPLPNYKQSILVTGCALTGIVSYNLFFFYGLQFISAGRGALVVALNPVVIAIFSWAFLKESMPTRKVGGIFIALIGCLLVISNGHLLALLQGRIGIGEWMILSCVLCWTFYVFLSHAAKKAGLSPLLITFYACLIGFALLLLLALSTGQFLGLRQYSFTTWSSVVFLGLFGTAIAFTWFIEAVAQLGPAPASAFLNLIPISAVLLGVLFLGETLNLLTVLGGGLILLGVFFTIRYSGAK